MYTFYNTNPLLDDCISFLQTEKKLNLFYAGKYSLSRFYNVNHFLTTEEIKPQLVLGTESKLPSWFSEKYGNQFSVMQTDFLKSDKGYETIELQNKLLVHSSEERAFLELLYDNPETGDTDSSSVNGIYSFNNATGSQSNGTITLSDGNFTYSGSKSNAPSGGTYTVSGSDITFAWTAGGYTVNTTVTMTKDGSSVTFSSSEVVFFSTFFGSTDQTGGKYSLTFSYTE